MGQYGYDGEGRRVKKIVGTEATIFVYDASGQLSAEYSTTVTPAEQAKVSYLTTDHLGSPRIITDQNGAVISRKDFTAFGENVTSDQRIGGTNGNEYDPPNVRQDYTGYQKDDESGLEFAQARYYNPSHGRFTSVDPLTASASIKNPQTFNRYSYVLNSPYKFSDPLGLLPVTTGANGGRAWCSTCKTSDDDTGGFADPPEPPREPAPEPPATEPAPAANPAPEQENQQEAQPPPPPPSGNIWIVNNIDALEAKVAQGGWAGKKSGTPPKTQCAALPQLWDLEDQGIPIKPTNTWLMGEQATPDRNIPRGAVLATFDRSTGTYRNQNSDNHTVIFLTWKSYKGTLWGTNHYMRVIEQGPSFAPRIREIYYSDSTFSSSSYFRNAWYYNVVRVK